MPRPWSCRVHGAGVATHWIRNGTQHGARARKRQCSVCHPPHGPTCEGLDACPRDGSTEFVAVPGRDGRRYRRCVRCRRVGWVSYRVRRAWRVPPPAELLELDPWTRSAAALAAALGAVA